MTNWTIRLALAAYAAYLGWSAWGATPRRNRGGLRILWTLAGLLVAGHTVAAFHWHHHWSHALAWTSTADRTEALLGWRFGAGVWFNYLLVAVWLGDLSWWWLDPDSRDRRPAWVDWALHGYVFLIAFNGAVVFESGPTRWAGLGAVVVVGLLLVGRFRGKTGP